MCGIFFYITQKEIDQDLIDNSIKLLNHRGPDQQSYEILKYGNWNILLVHTRLKINGNDTKQPLTNNKKTIYLIMNGEIFNYKEIAKDENFSDCEKSDCEIILKLYERYGESNLQKDIFEKLNGQYSFVLLDLERGLIFSGRDHVGITPLYYGYTSDGQNLLFASELKVLSQEEEMGESLVKDIKIFYPRNYMIANIESNINFKIYEWKNYFNSIEDTSLTRLNVQETIKKKLIESVHLRLRDLIANDIDFGVLVSGGLDSSLICSIINEYMKENNINKPIKTFSIGVDKESVDLKYARLVSEYLKTEHNEYTFTLKEGVDSLEKVIWHIETYDTTSVRASTPMYLLTNKIKESYPNLKVLFSGEGADELFLSYRYGQYAPSSEHFYKENKNLISNVHKFDCLRANKSCMAHGIEVRVPFLDVNFVEYIMSLPVKFKLYNDDEGMEKQILRESFTKYLPEKVLWRIKEQFSDGVSSIDDKTKKSIPTNWINYLQYWSNMYNYKGEKIDNLYFNVCKVNNLHTYLSPETNEQLLYRQFFCKLFNDYYCKNTSEYTVRFWKPVWTASTDPSGRVYSIK